MDTASSPSDAATFTAAPTMRSRSRPGFGPLRGRRRRPQASSMLAGRPVSLSSSIGSLAVYLRIIYAVLRTQNAEGAEPPMTDQPAIEAIALEKSYGAVPVLAGVDLRVERGSVFSLLGPNGAGKTTIGADPVDAAAGRRRPGARGGLRRRRRPARGAARDQPHGPVRRGRRAPDRRGEPAHDGTAGRPRPRRRTCPRPRAADAVRPHRRRRSPGRDVLGRDAPAPRPRGEPRRAAVGDLPRRADDRSRPSQPAGDVGRDHRPRGLGRDASS